jgi:hypothetical protein
MSSDTFDSVVMSEQNQMVAVKGANSVCDSMGAIQLGMRRKQRVAAQAAHMQETN